jgi:hypothetical protein
MTIPAGQDTGDSASPRDRVVLACRGRRGWRPTRLEIVAAAVVALLAAVTAQWAWLLAWLALEALFVFVSQFRVSLSITGDAVHQSSVLVTQHAERARIVDLQAVGNAWTGRRLVLHGTVELRHRWISRPERRTAMQIADVFDCPLEAIEAELRSRLPGGR